MTHEISVQMRHMHMETMCICSCEMAAGGIGSPCKRHHVESRFVCMMQEHERVLQEMLVALCLCVSFWEGYVLGVFLAGCSQRIKLTLSIKCIRM